MKYLELVGYYEKLEGTAKKLEKRDILAELYSKCGKELPETVLLSMGIVFPAGEKELGIAKEIVRKVIAKTYGIDEKDVTEKFKETGDLGLAAEFFSAGRKQKALAARELDIAHVSENLRKLPGITGHGSQERKISLVSELLSLAAPEEARYIVRTIIGDMRIGVAAGIVRDAIARAFNKDAKEVERLFDVTGDYGKVAELASKGTMKAEIELFRPVRVMLADRSPGLETALKEFENPALETKYDGFRIAVHKNGSSVKIFSRRLEDVTNQFPDIAKWSRENIRARNCIVEGETLAVGKDGKPRPFQELSRRIQRKYDIEKTAKEIPVQVNLFDIIYCDGESWMDRPLKERWKKLGETVNETKHFGLADHLETKDFAEADEFYRNSLGAGQEGVIVKNMDAHYQPGRRVGFWLKVKPVMEPLDLVVMGAEWGEGKRTNYLGSLILGARSGDKFLDTGRMASGMIEKEGEKNLPTMEALTKRLKKLIISEEGKTARVKPEIVIEVSYEEIQKSPKYPTGYALRFPRILRIRDDKSPGDANTVRDIEKLFAQQKGRGK